MFDAIHLTHHNVQLWQPWCLQLLVPTLCQHDIVSRNDLSLGFGETFLAEMSDDGNACGSHLQFQKQKTEPNRDYSLEVFQHTGDARQIGILKQIKKHNLQIHWGLVQLHQFGWVVCMINQFYNLYLVWVEWNAVGSVDYSACTPKLALPLSSGRVACNAE